MDITEHFTYEEMTFSETALRLGVPNKPDAEEFIHLEYTAQQMEKVRSLLGVPIAVTSAFRSPYLNKLLGGAITSSHCYGLACDFKPIGLRLIAAAKTIEESDIKYDQLILEYGWIHLGFGALMRRESLTKRSKAAPYEKGLVL
jgi:hypothetical protein